MNTYIVLLRGINVSGKNKIRMAELRSHLTDSGFVDVETYIQSGNIVLRSEISSCIEISSLVEETIKSKLKLDVHALAIIPKDLKEIVLKNPFARVEEDASKVLITFLWDVPSEDKRIEYNSLRFPPDSAIIIDRAIYLHLPEGAAKSKYTNVLTEKRLGVIASGRNLRTCTTLLNMTFEPK